RPGVYTTDPDNFHFENQFADTGTTYIWTSFQLPEQAKLVIKGQYPHMRHWNFVLYTPDGGFPTTALSDSEIYADAGSSNPFRDGVRRDVTQRNYTIQIVNGDKPDNPAANTLYTLAKPGEAIPLVMRNYVPDTGTDMLGNAPWPEVELHYADGKVVKGEEACATTNTLMRGIQAKVNVSHSLWLGLTHVLASDPLTAPARDFTAEGMEAFFNRFHLVFNLFAPNIAALNKEPSTKGGWYSNPATRYGYKYMNYRFGKVYAIRGKLPVTPLTYKGDAAPLRKSDMLYWSMCTNMGLSTGMAIDCLYDEELEPLLDGDRRYTIVTTRLADRPANATEKCGVAWMEFGNGDGVYGGSPDTMLLVNRVTRVDPAFKHSWFSVPKPGDERAAMGDYHPQIINVREKAAFEALGCPVDTRKLDAMTSATS
ncbi:MAG: hypothetical protein H7Y28_09285, partial [Rhodoferax sp.]|nr:hypothetical protein [Rhodoferax sp.]